MARLRPAGRKAALSTVALGLIVASGAGGCAAAGASGAGVTICELELQGALPGGRPLTIHAAFRDGGCRRAFGLARTFNRASHLVDASRLKLEGAALKGRLKVTVRPDHWVPRGGKPVPCTFDVAATLSAGKLEGSFKGRYGDRDVSGAVGGKIGPRPATPKMAMLMFEFFHPFDARPRGGHLAGELVVREGKVAAGRFFVIPSSPTHYGSHGRMGKLTVRLAGDAIRGSFIGVETSGSGEAETYDFAVDGAVIGGVAGGTLAGKVGGKEAVNVPFYGTLRPVGEVRADNCQYRVILHGALPKAHMMEISLVARGGRFGGGFGVTTINRATCEVDAAGLKVANGRVGGPMGVVVNVDDWIPRDRKPIPCSYTVDMTVKDRLVSGSFRGTGAGADVRGIISGYVEPLAAARQPLELWLKLIKGIRGVTGGWVAMGVTVAGGKAKFRNFPIPGALEEAKFDFRGGRFAGTIRAKMSKGTYNGKLLDLVFDGKVIGDRAAGDIDVRIDGKTVSRENFFALVR